MLARGKAALRIAATFGNKREVLIGELGVAGMSFSFFLSYTRLAYDKRPKQRETRAHSPKSAPYLAGGRAIMKAPYKHIQEGARVSKT